MIVREYYFQSFFLLGAPAVSCISRLDFIVAVRYIAPMRFSSGTKPPVLRLIVSVIVCAMSISSVSAQESPHIPSPLRILANVPYTSDRNGPQKLNIYSHLDDTTPRPTVIFFQAGNIREEAALSVMPYLEKGWNAVNVEFSIRPSGVPMAPAATEDSLCALRWVVKNGREYGLDKSQLVVSGASAGGTLALTTAMITDWPGLDIRCPIDEQVKVAAVVNWYGVFDLLDVMEGPNIKSYAANWFDGPNARDAAIRVSPRTYLGSSNPPIISIHGDADPRVPYEHSLNLHKALAEAGVTQALVTIRDGKHGGFTENQNRTAYDAVWTFLKARGINMTN